MLVLQVHVSFWCSQKNSSHLRRPYTKSFGSDLQKRYSSCFAEAKKMGAYKTGLLGFCRFRKQKSLASSVEEPWAAGTVVASVGSFTRTEVASGVVDDWILKALWFGKVDYLGWDSGLNVSKGC